MAPRGRYRQASWRLLNSKKSAMCPHGVGRSLPMSRAMSVDRCRCLTRCLPIASDRFRCLTLCLTLCLWIASDRCRCLTRCLPIASDRFRCLTLCLTLCLPIASDRHRSLPMSNAMSADRFQRLSSATDRCPLRPGAAENARALLRRENADRQVGLAAVSGGRRRDHGGPGPLHRHATSIHGSQQT